MSFLEVFSTLYISVIYSEILDQCLHKTEIILL